MVEPRKGGAGTIRLSVWDSAILLSGLALVLGIFLAVTLVRPELAVYFLWFTILTILLAVPLVIGCVTRRMDPFDPTAIIAACYFLYFVYAPIRSLLAGQYYFFGKLVMPLLPLGSLYLVFGIIGMWAGYYASGIARRAARALPSPPATHRGVISYAWIVALLAIVAFNAYAHSVGLSWFRLLTLGQFGSSSAAVETLSQASRGAFGNYLYSTLDWLTSALMLLYAFSHRGRKWLLAAFVAVLLVYTTIGFRFRVVVLVLAPMIYHYLSIKRRPGVLRMAGVAVGIMLLIGAIGMSRSSFRAGEDIAPAGVSISSSRETFSNDLNIYQGYLAIIDAFPRDHGYLWGSSFAYLLLQPIPRGLWPDKPEAPVGTIVDVVLGPDAVAAGIAYPNVGEFYANFGAAGLFACMWIFGFFARVLYEYLGQHESNDWARIIYAVSIPFIIQVISRGYFVQIFQEGAFLLLPLILGMWICGRGSRVQSPALARAGAPSASAGTRI